MTEVHPTPDEDLVPVADLVTLWVASRPAPKEFWSLREALAWANGHVEKSRITLFRPPCKGTAAIWIKPDQIERLAHGLAARAA